MKASRLDQIEQYIIAQGSVSLVELSETFHVSLNTIRRDVTELLKRGRIKKVYGGVTADESPVTPMAIREAANNPEKERIGQLAAALVHDGDTIFLDSGSTTPYILPYLKEVQDVTIISHNLKVIEQASAAAQFHLIAIGGEYNHRTCDFSGIASSAETLDQYHINYAFLATTAVSLRYGLANTSFLEAEMKRKIVAASERAVLMADHSKFSKNAAIAFCSLEKLFAIVTDRAPEQAFSDACEQKNIRLYY